MRSNRWLTRAIISTLALSPAALLYGQIAVSSTAADQPNVCSAIALKFAVTLTLRQRACIYGEDLISRKLALTAGFVSAFGQAANLPSVPHQRMDEFPHRFATYYATHAARGTGELLAGYLHRESQQHRGSLAHGFWHRTDEALISVLTSPDENGSFRLAYAPIAGSLGAGIVGSAMYHHKDTLSEGLTHAGLIYSKYFLRAIFAEFKPDIKSYARHKLHRDKD